MKKILPIIPFIFCAQSNANSLEVLHWWTAPGELQAKAILDEALAKQNIEWKDFAIVGSGGDSALRVLQMRALSGNPPDAAQIKGPDIAEWAKMGMLKEVDNVVATQAWDQHLPEIVKQTVTYQGKYMALPLNIHRVNWLWLNKEIFDELNLSAPKTWDAFFDSADKIQAAGYIPIAHGGTSWQDLLLFESVAISLLGANNYKRAFVDFDETVLKSDKMIEAFTLFKKLNQYVGENMRGTDWVAASHLLTNKKAGMMFMGDWAKGMWHAEGKVAMQDYLCVNVPGSENVFSYNIDSFVFFDMHNKAGLADINTQTFATTLLSDEFQRTFNIEKGSMPVRTNMDMDAFDVCTQKAAQDFNNGLLVPSFSQNMATGSYLRSEMSKIISAYFNSDYISAQQVSKQLALAIRALHK